MSRDSNPGSPPIWAWNAIPLESLGLMLSQIKQSIPPRRDDLTGPTVSQGQS
jgi:hypothetical protein